MQILGREMVIENQETVREIKVMEKFLKSLWEPCMYCITMFITFKNRNSIIIVALQYSYHDLGTHSAEEK